MLRRDKVKKRSEGSDLGTVNRSCFFFMSGGHIFAASGTEGGETRKNIRECPQRLAFLTTTTTTWTLKLS